MREAAGLKEVEINKDYSANRAKKEEVSMYQHETNAFVFQGNSMYDSNELFGEQFDEF